MPFCPRCKYEYRPEVERCPECDVTLVQNLPEDSGVEELVPCWRTNNYIKADVICGVLRQSGIPCNIETLGGIADGAYPLPQVKPSSYTILVPEDKIPEAVRIIEEQEDLPIPAEE